MSQPCQAGGSIEDTALKMNRLCSSRSPPAGRDPSGVKGLFHRGHISDIYIMIHNSKILLRNSSENCFMVADTGGTVLRATASGRLRTTGQRLSEAVLPFLTPELECSRRLNIQFLNEISYIRRHH